MKKETKESAGGTEGKRRRVNEEVRKLVNRTNDRAGINQEERK